MARDFFDIYYKKLEESILSEKMSDEDRRDSDLLKSAIAKTRERTNAKLTAEEKEVLDKYNLYRDDRAIKIKGMTGYHGSSNDIGDLEGGYPIERGRKDKYRTWSSRKVSAKHNPDEVNYADIARKRLERDNHAYDNYLDDKINQYRSAQRDLQSAIWSRDHHQRYIDNADATYFAALQKAKKDYDDAVARANSQRDSVDKYNTPGLDRAKAEIDSIYSRFKK